MSSLRLDAVSAMCQRNLYPVLKQEVHDFAKSLNLTRVYFRAFVPFQYLMGSEEGLGFDGIAAKIVMRVFSTDEQPVGDKTGPIMRWMREQNPEETEGCTQCTQFACRMAIPMSEMEKDLTVEGLMRLAAIQFESATHEIKRSLVEYFGSREVDE